MDEKNDDDDEEVERCPICLSLLEDENKEKGAAVKECPNGHAFHARCLDRWLDVSRDGTCPSCRTAIIIITKPATRPFFFLHVALAFLMIWPRWFLLSRLERYSIWDLFGLCLYGFVSRRIWHRRWPDTIHSVWRCALCRTLTMIPWIYWNCSGHCPVLMMIDLQWRCMLAEVAYRRVCRKLDRLERRGEFCPLPWPVLFFCLGAGGIIATLPFLHPPSIEYLMTVHFNVLAG